jgi:anti-sigma factor ChrR (cupin superfamily)
MSESERAAEYVLGTLSAEEREAVARAAEHDPALAEALAAWNAELAPLLSAREVEPPADMFARITARIAARTTQERPAREERASVTVRADEGRWETLVPGVERKMLRVDRARKRVTFLVRAAPGARFPAHLHDDDEEAYVISGDLTFETLTLHAGDYHVARRGMAHPAAVSIGGCLLLITAGI